MIAGHLGGSRAFGLLFEEAALAGPAELQNSGDIDCPDVNGRASRLFGQRLHEAFAAQAGAITIQGDGVHPGQHQIIVSELP